MIEGLLLPALTGALLIVEFLVAWACYSLRDFSRSRLDEICRERGRENRFGAILKQHEEVLLSAEIVFLVLLVALAAVAAAWFGLPPALETASDRALWPASLVRWLLFALVLVFAIVVFPWTAARVGGEKFLYFTWPVLRLLLVPAAPLLSLNRRIDKLMHRVAGVEEPTAGDATAIAEEIRTVVDEGQREGILEPQAGSMIQRVMELAQGDVADIMTPRTDMVSIHADSSLEEARVRLLDAGHSRVPVVGESTDDIVGILYAKDLLKHLHAANGQAATLREIVRDPLYVPETTGIDALLETMKREQIHLAIVLDEYGGVAGLVTMEDILEEIVGEIVDEYDLAEEVSIRKVSPGVVEVDARVHIDDLNEEFNYDLPENGDYDTIGGFAVTQLGRVPEPSESFTWRQLRITVLEADKRKIDKLRIEVDPALAATTADET